MAKAKFGHEATKRRREQIMLRLSGNIVVQVHVVKRIANELGIREAVVRRECKEIGVKILTPSLERIPSDKATKELTPKQKEGYLRRFDNYQVIAALFDKTKTLREIAERFGVSPQMVHIVYKKCVAAGIDLPHKSAKEGRSRGGKARAKKLTAEQLSDHGRRMVEARRVKNRFTKDSKET